MTQIAKEFIDKLQSMSDAEQMRYIQRWLRDLEGSDGAIDEPVLEEKPAPTFEDIKHLLGVYDDLPPDLSSNKEKYMQGFGAKSMGLETAKSSPLTPISTSTENIETSPSMSSCRNYSTSKTSQ